MKRFLLFSLLFFLIPGAYANDGIFSILNESYVQNASELPPPSVTPEIVWQCQGNICAWVDIAGYNQTIRENGVDYIQGNPIDSAIIKYDIKINQLRSRVVTDYRVNCYWCVVDSITKTVSVTQDGKNITATLTVVLKWHENLESYGTTQRIDYVETSVFTDTEPVPLQYPALKEPQVIVTQYNNSLYENIGIKIYNDNCTKITFDYKDKHAVRTFKILHVENNYGNITTLEQWNINGTGISRFYEEILIDGNLTQMNLSEFGIRAYNAFTSVKANPANFTIRRVEFKPGESFGALFFGFIGIVGVLAYSSLYLLRRINKWHINIF